MALPKLETPTYTLKLPSTGQTILFRPFLVKEYKILMTLSEADDDELSRILTELIDVCTFNKLKINELASFDLEYIFLMLRAKSIGETIDLYLNCSACGERNDVTVNILDLKVDKFDKHSNLIEIQNELSVELRYPTFKEVLDLFQKGTETETFDLVSKCMKNIYTKDDTFSCQDQTEEELKQFIFSMTKEQFDKIENFFVTMPKIRQYISKDCTKCGHPNETKLEGLQNFFV